MPDAGSWPDWIGTGVSFVALIVASVAAWATIKTNRAQSAAIEMQRQGLEDVHTQRKREQADKFMVWYGDGAYNFANLSDKPIFEVILVINLEKDPSKDELVFKLDRSTEIPSPILPDGQIYRLPIQWQFDNPLNSIYFYDARRIAWRIDENLEGMGVPEEVTIEEMERIDKYGFYLSQEELLSILENPEAHRH